MVQLFHGYNCCITSMAVIPAIVNLVNYILESCTCIKQNESSKSLECGINRQIML